jgi:D-glycero-alpha-D-manno-heptose-7-phosphate kinase
MFRAKAPLRLGLAGGGTDVSPYSDLYGGAVLNATISMYAYATLELRNDGKFILHALDKNEKMVTEAKSTFEVYGTLALIKGVYNRVINNYVKRPLALELSTFVDAPAGSGLGTSSTLVVAILGAFIEWLKLPLGEYDIAHLAYEIEREDLGLAGGKQDQYAATFGGFNFMEFYGYDKIIVNPLRIKRDFLSELELNLVLYNTGTSRLSSKIIEAQTINVVQKEEKSIEAMHKLKEQAVLMKEAILKGKLDKIGEILDFGWQHKKQMAEGITNPIIDEIYETAIKAGATGGKISGAGGGGFMMFYCPKNTRYKVIEALQKFGGECKRYQFAENGLVSWRV